MDLILKKQEVKGNYQFNGQIFMTKGFQVQFGEKATSIVFEAMELIRKRITKEGADYLQVFMCDNVRFWVIDDITHISFLLPEEY